MTDEELIARLRAVCTCNIDSTPCMAEDDCRDALAAADRIGALVKERDNNHKVGLGWAEIAHQESNKYLQALRRIELLATTCEQLVATNEALVRERDQWIEHTKSAVWSDSEELKLANDRIKWLEAAGKAYREATRHLRPCPETAANFDAALKGEKP